MERLRSYEVKDTVRKVTRTQPEVFEAYGEEKHLVAVMDYGVKQNIIECLAAAAVRWWPCPPIPRCGEVLSGGFDGVMLSNGPGDPEENTEIIAELRKLYDSTIPIFGVCMGHQLLAPGHRRQDRPPGLRTPGRQPPRPGPGEEPRVHHQPEPRLYGPLRHGGPRRGRGIPYQR